MICGFFKPNYTRPLTVIGFRCDGETSTTTRHLRLIHPSLGMYAKVGSRTITHLTGCVHAECLRGCDDAKKVRSYDLATAKNLLDAKR